MTVEQSASDVYDRHPYAKFEPDEIERRLNLYLPGALDFPEDATDDANPLGPAFAWQNGPRGAEGQHENGLLPTDLIHLAQKRLEFLNSSLYEEGRYRDRHNSLAITALEQAFAWCVQRTIGRVKRGVSGRSQP